MVTAFDRIVIAVPEMVAASAEYRELLGVDPLPVETSGPSRVWFPLPNTVIELVQSSVGYSQIRGVVFNAAEAGGADAPFKNSRGLEIDLCNGGRTAAARKRLGAGDSESLRVDHLVLRTGDAEECIDLFGRQLGIRLALDRTVPEWGGRMLFFRTGKLTLEIIESQQDRTPADYFWGIAYQCRDLEQTAALLSGRGVRLSEVRAGRKPGSLVATVKSHCLGIPTLLLQPLN
jgi:predicted enzyme related to lactoylglutathione lyase